jgi:hypothetical protein
MSAKAKTPENHRISGVLIPFRIFISGERGIRTPGPVTVNSFQDCRNRPLCHFSNKSGIVTLSGAEGLMRLQI